MAYLSLESVKKEPLRAEAIRRRDNIQDSLPRAWDVPLHQILTESGGVVREGKKSALYFSTV